MGIYKTSHINVIIADVNNYIINIIKDIIDISMNLADGRAGAIIYTLSLLNVILIIIYILRGTLSVMYLLKKEIIKIQIYIMLL